MIQGYHGTGKSTIGGSARLNWPCIRVNLDSHISRIDLVGKDAIVLREYAGYKFKEGILPGPIRPQPLSSSTSTMRPPDVMFVIQRVLEAEGKLTLLDQSRVLHPHKSFACSQPPTVGLGDTTGFTTPQINQGQMVAGTSSRRSTTLSTMLSGNRYPAPQFDTEEGQDD